MGRIGVGPVAEALQELLAEERVNGKALRAGEVRP